MYVVYKSRYLSYLSDVNLVALELLLQGLPQEEEHLVLSC